MGAWLFTTLTSPLWDWLDAINTDDYATPVARRRWWR